MHNILVRTVRVELSKTFIGFYRMITYMDEHVVKYEDGSLESPLFTISNKEVRFWKFWCVCIDELRVVDAEGVSSTEDIPRL
jgi:hypothetical protein